MSTSQIILRITPLTFSSHPLHLSFLLRYHALLSTSLTITSSFADLEIEPFVRPPLPTHYFSLTGSVDVQPSSKIFWTPNSFSILPLPLKTSYPATTRHYLISSTLMPHTVRHTIRRTDGRHTETHIQADRRTGIHIELEKHSGGQMGYIQSDTHSDEKKDRHTCTYTVIETFSRTEGRHKVRQTFRRTEGQTYSQTHIQVDRTTDILYSHRNIHTKSKKHSGEQKEDIKSDTHSKRVRETFRRTDGRHTVRHTFRRTEGNTYINSQRNIQAEIWETDSQTHIQADRIRDIHIQSENHSGAQKEDIQS